MLSYYEVFPWQYSFFRPFPSPCTEGKMKRNIFLFVITHFLSHFHRHFCVVPSPFSPSFLLENLSSRSSSRRISPDKSSWAQRKYSWLLSKNFSGANRRGREVALQRPGGDDAAHDSRFFPGSCAGSRLSGPSRAFRCTQRFIGPRATKGGERREEKEECEGKRRKGRRGRKEGDGRRWEGGGERGRREGGGRKG